MRLGYTAALPPATLHPGNAVLSTQPPPQPEVRLRPSVEAATYSWGRERVQRLQQYQHSQPQQQNYDDNVQRSAVQSPRVIFPCGNVCAILLACQLATVVAILMALGLTFLPSTWQNGDGLDNHTDDHPRARKVLHLVWYVGNNSLNPCTDFQRYTCYNYDAAQTHGNLFGWLEPMRNTLEGLSRTDAGRLLFVFYSSCLKTMWTTSSAGRQSIRAIMDTIYLDPKMSKVHLLATVVKLNIAYGLHGSLIIYQNHYGKFPSALPAAMASSVPIAPSCNTENLFIFATPKTLLHHGKSTDVTVQGHIGEAIEELGKQGVNVTAKQLMQFADSLLISSREAGYFIDKTELLGKLVPGVSARLWIDMVKDCTSLDVDRLLVHSSLDILKRRLSILLDRELQPVNIAFIVMEAAVAMIWDGVTEKRTVDGFYRFCEEAARTLRPVWALNDLLNFAAKTEHNHAIITTFQRLADTIKEQLKESLNSQDAIVLEHKLKSMRLYLPYQIYPVDMALPNLTAENFFSNELRLRQWRLTADRYMPPRGVCRNQAEFVHLLHPVLGTNSISIPLSLYKATALDPTTFLLPMATFGYVIADRLWSALFNVPWTPNGEDIFRQLDSLNERANKDRAGITHLRGNLISRPHLALALCVRALRRYRWHDLSLYWGHWRTSRSRVFYRLLVLYYYCGERYYAKSDLVRAVNTLMLGTADFLDAFNCPHDLPRRSFFSPTPQLALST